MVHTCFICETSYSSQIYIPFSLYKKENLIEDRNVMKHILFYEPNYFSLYVILEICHP